MQRAFRKICHFRIIALSILAMLSAALAKATSTKFECTISSDRTTYTVGEIPSFTVSIANKSDRETVLVGSLDGSAWGMRSPLCMLVVRDRKGTEVKSSDLRCGNMNELKVSDFVTVPAGGVFNPFADGFFLPPQFYQFPVTEPGEYSIRFSYSTLGRIQDFLGDERLRGQTTAASRIMRLFKKVPQLKLESNELKLRFLPKNE